jgi:Fe2+ or Zn2+ uptake regulation protein
MIPMMTRAQGTQLRLGGLAAQILPIVCKDQQNAYAYAVHQKIVATYGDQHASMADVGRTLQTLVEQGILTSQVEQGTNRTQPRTFYHPTFIAGMWLGFTQPQAEWESLGLAPKPEVIRKAS